MSAENKAVIQKNQNSSSLTSSQPMKIEIQAAQSVIETKRQSERPEADEVETNKPISTYQGDQVSNSPPVTARQ